MSSSAADAAPQSRSQSHGEPGQPGYQERSCLSKRRYWSQVDALIMAARCAERRNVGPLGAYRCANCAGWHLTRRL